ncbi:hypothetical protein PoB_002674400 [Plakobranchus ocellatus]|uniref:Uncharacterized protein n=1 Tax=Plakobranchus ocellatus TaxID=259542 RepID=A0AAV4A204_9GAST|nr:hypothetical protein PoB_002674400 [Plakobranchus ocellatus]
MEYQAFLRCRVERSNITMVLDSVRGYKPSLGTIPRAIGCVDWNRHGGRQKQLQRDFLLPGARYTRHIEPVLHHLVSVSCLPWRPPLED